MSNKPVVKATLNIEMNVNCPHCDTLIDLLDENDTDGVWHDDEAVLLRQMFPDHGTHDDFECEDVTCTQCKTTFNVKELEW